MDDVFGKGFFSFVLSPAFSSNATHSSTFFFFHFFIITWSDVLSVDGRISLPAAYGEHGEKS